MHHSEPKYKVRFLFICISQRPRYLGPNWRAAFSHTIRGTGIQALVAFLIDKTPTARMQPSQAFEHQNTPCHSPFLATVPITQCLAPPRKRAAGVGQYDFHASLASVTGGPPRPLGSPRKLMSSKQVREVLVVLVEGGRGVAQRQPSSHVYTGYPNNVIISGRSKCNDGVQLTFLELLV